MYQFTLLPYNISEMLQHMVKPETVVDYIPEQHLAQTGIAVRCDDVSTNTAQALDQLQSNRQKGVSPYRSVDLAELKTKIKA